MATLKFTDSRADITRENEIAQCLRQFGINYERWPVRDFPEEADTSELLEFWKPQIDDIMKEGGYKSADIIKVAGELPLDVRQKFLPEHTHAEDEVRFFVKGNGLFWFHIKEEVFSILCEEGDFLSVPAGTRHWFDFGADPDLIAIRIFTNPEGWVAKYTDSGIEKDFNPEYHR